MVNRLIEWGMGRVCLGKAPRPRFVHFAALCSAALAVSLTPSASATPRPLPYTYQHEQLPTGESELEQFVDFTPVRARPEESTTPVWYGLTQFQAEYEHGITDRIELGLYLTYVPSVATGFAEAPRSSEGTGLKQRLRFALADTGAWPIDVGLYLELVENEREIETEAKIILQRRFGPLRAIANLGAEREYYYDGRHDIVLNPSAGLTFEATPSIQPGIEWWMRAEYPEENAPHPRPFDLGPHHYVGPAVLIQLGRLWWAAGVYFRVSDTSHTLQLNEGYGNIWARSVLGFGL
jgi:hypothetical protein